MGGIQAKEGPRRKGLNLKMVPKQLAKEHMSTLASTFFYFTLTFNSDINVLQSLDLKSFKEPLCPHIPTLKGGIKWPMISVHNK